MNIEPLFDRIVIKQVDAEVTTASGILLPGNSQEKPQIATVLAVGPGGVIDGKEIKMVISVGDKILYPNYAGSEFKYEGEDYIILRQSDVLAKIKN